MTMPFLRIAAGLVLLLAGLTFTLYPSAAASLASAPAVNTCCGHGAELPATSQEPTGDCTGTECGCATCLIAIPSTAQVIFSSHSLAASTPHNVQTVPPTGYLASIDYPPERG